ncbi:MAG: lipid IV(A) 3-deoxy-D-manno-octulosonic acid transferase [Burkholderiales bacterium]|nr:lipid IV(A) 3-deoxy-D-manno-octulosonic acid transferase [Burkholderiales bacterium]
MIWRLGYRLLLWLLFPWALIHLWWRGRRQPGYRAHIAERFGWYHNAAPNRPVIWLHAVSVGETRAAEPLLRALAARYPGHEFVLTQMTPTGRETAQQLFGSTATIAYLPYDYPAAVARFLTRFRPSLGILMETEIWFNLVGDCARRGIPLLLANARMSEKSARGYELVSPLTHVALRRLAAVSAQTREDARRLEHLGAPAVEVTGNLKFDVVVEPRLLALGAVFRQRIGPRPVLLAASTREGEEELVLDAYSRIGIEGLLLLLVPRHPQRFDEVAALLQKRKLAYARRSEDGLLPRDCRVLLGDSMGEMAAYYAACDLAFIGGSLLPYGGQNLIEACAVGRPLLFGPHMYNFSEASRLALDGGAALGIVDVVELAERAEGLLSDRAALARMSQAALTFSRAHQGATARNLAICERLLKDGRKAAAN